ncbi:MAG: DoxX family protein [Caldilineaceae bacterium]
MNLNIALWVAQALLALLFLLTGAMKALQPERTKARLHALHDLPTGLVTFIGVSELLGSAGLVLPWLTGILPWLTPLAAAGLALIMLLAIGTHLRLGDHMVSVMNIVLLGLTLFIGYGRWFVA